METPKSLKELSVGVYFYFSTIVLDLYESLTINRCELVELKGYVTLSLQTHPIHHHNERVV
jgi:hypothetical protein